MGRLIDADELNAIKEKLRIFDSFISTVTRQCTDEHQAIYEHWIDCRYDIENIIDKLPTAYDVSKVVAELEVMEEKRVRFAKQILDYWDKQGTQQTILFLKDIVENKSIEEQKQAVRSKNELSDHLRRIIEQNDERFSFE